MFSLFLALRLLSFRRISLSAILQDWAAAFLFSWMAIPIALLAILDSILWRNGKTRLSLSHGVHFLYPKNFFSSLKELSFLPECLLFCAWLFCPNFTDPLGFIGLLYLLLPKKTEENIVFLLLKEAVLRFKKQRPVAQNWNIRNEKYRLLDPNYPLLRRTLSFCGKKTFDLRIGKNEKPHLIFLFLESFRMKEVGKFSPHFEQLAKEGVLFTQFHANGTRTSHGSIAALYGVPPTYAPSYLNFYLDIPLIGVPQVMKGYESVLIQSGHLAFCQTHDFFSTHGFSKLFGKNEILKTIPNAPSTSWGLADEATFQFAAEMLLKEKKPLFLTLFTITNHHPWRLPGKKTGSFQETFSYTDKCLGDFIQRLEPILDQCIFFILADHGQGLGERDGNFLLNRHLYQENVHVPLLIYAKGRIEAPKRIDEPASQVDLLPTVLDLFKIQEPHHSLGRSLQREGSAPIYLTQPNDGDPLIGWRSGAFKTIRHLASGKEEFYDLAADPLETNDLKTGSAEALPFAERLHSLYCQKKLCPKETLEKNPYRLSLKGQLDVKVEDFLGKNLISLDLSNCVLLTDKNIETILEGHSDLEELDLQGVDDLTGNWAEKNGQSLAFLNLLDCPKLQGKKIAAWIASLPQLWCLKIDGTGLQKEDYRAMGRTSAQWEHLEIANAHALDDETLEWLLREQRDLSYLALTGAKTKEMAPLRRLPIRFLHISGQGK